METLTTEARSQLLRFVCSFAWADLEISEQERSFVMDLARRFALTPQEMADVEAWLLVPPHPDSIDPQDIPPEHKALFLEKARAVIRADGRVDERESTNYRLFRELLSGR